ncbi:hypothetical protein CN335_21400 [Bacillus thuringiensis]|uniref:hypothetical protein n=1 Tax=Bacillus thuringiensis TaxID=1428 RepID=UPI000BF96FAD|nr:hypothetical protein [Bacillus thuringiensis]NIL33283.1 hypothetical protein [Bacillus thuringiensis]PFF33248.1 hypothetical protein CN335_21400 [Bacillus thuringiensis]PFT16959.1 hypothetical protein COK83_10215 [Bacillus thuringiensis]
MLLENWPSILRYGLPIVISLASFIVSFITYRANKKSLDVTFEPDLLEIANINTGSHSVENPNGIFLCFLKVVNPSSTDIGYFDLRVFDDDQPNSTLFTYNELTLKRFSKGDSDYFDYISPIGIANLNAPSSNYGVFKSNSYTRIDIPFSPNLKTKSVTVTFKVAIKSLKSNPYANHRKKFKFYSATYEVESNVIKKHNTNIS